jgi:hypothetical protein
MSVATSPPPGGATPAAPARVPAAGACPLCGAPLHPDQGWCLNCGAAARTRLAASPSWKGLIAALAVVVALALGVLAAALVSLSGGSSTTPAITRTVTSAAALTSTPASTPTTATSANGAATLGTSTTGAK